MKRRERQTSQWNFGWENWTHLQLVTILSQCEESVILRSEPKIYWGAEFHILETLQFPVLFLSLHFTSEKWLRNGNGVCEKPSLLSKHFLLWSFQFQHACQDEHIRCWSSSFKWDPASTEQTQNVIFARENFESSLYSFFEKFILRLLQLSQHALMSSERFSWKCLTSIFLGMSVYYVDKD